MAGRESINGFNPGWWEECNVQGNAGFVLHAKLKHLKGRIKTWVKNDLGRIEKKICMLENLLMLFDCKEEDRLLTAWEIEKKNRIGIELRTALKREDKLCSSKARTTWHLEGDRCTKYHHRLVLLRSNSNNIFKLLSDGQVFS